MRFARYPLRGPRQWTPRRSAAAARAVRRERGAVPLFPELARYSTTEDRIAEVNADHDTLVTRMRAFRAGQWRRARRLLAEMPATRRLGFLRLWNARIYPADPTYLLSLIHAVRHGSPWTKLRELHLLPAAGRRWRVANGWCTATQS